MEIDLTVNNFKGVHNSRLLLAYFSIDQRAHILVKTLKSIFKSAQVLDGT